MRSLELFTGAGGLALGTHIAGFRHNALVERDKNACRTLRCNATEVSVPGISKWRVIEGDVKTLAFDDLGPVDLVAGGVPCQPFSLGGKHKGMNDERNLFPEFLRAVRALTPRSFVVENVRGLLRRGFRSYFSYILLQLTYPGIRRNLSEKWEEHLRRLEDIHTRGIVGGLRYNVVFQLLNVADYGVPQVRERVFIVGFRSDTGVEWHFPSPTHSRDALLREQFVSGEYWDRHGLPHPSQAECMTLKGRKTTTTGELFPTKPWRTVRDAIADLPSPRKDRESKRFYNHRLNPGARPYPGHTGSHLDLPAKTLKAGVHGVPGGENMLLRPDGSVQYFTVREAARLQTFPDNWRFEGAWSEAMRQLGNAVPVDIAIILARSIASSLKRSNGGKRIQSS